MEEFEFSQKLMSCDFEVSIISESEKDAQNAFEKILLMGKEYEKRFSRFLKDSELSRLNDKKVLKVSEDFLSIFKIAMELYKESGGKFNPLVDISRFGYDKTFSEIKNSEVQKVDPKYSVDFSELSVDWNNRIISLGRNQKIDVAGFLKGYLSEKMSEKLSKFPGSIVNIGGDLTVRGRDENGKKFVFYLENPLKKNNPIGITLENQSMSTSGNYRRKWKVKGKNFHHILNSDGRKNPENDLLSATVISENGARSDAYATAAMTLKESEIEKYFSERKIKYIIINKMGKIIKNI